MRKRDSSSINSTKIINAWCSYDIANSAYNLSIATVLYPIYYQESTLAAFNSEYVQLLGTSIKSTVLYEYAIALGYLIAIFATLTLSGLADIGGYRKRFMQCFTLLGSISCMGLFRFTGQNIGIGLLLPALAVIGFAGSLVYYNSFLPLIATPDRHDRISARGFSYGYAGSMFLLIFNLFSIENYDSFGFADKSEAVRFAFIEVGLWWFLIAQIAFYYLSEKRGNLPFHSKLITHGFKELRSVFHIIKSKPSMYRFLLAFFFFSMGVQTIIIVASLFGSSELGISSTKLIITILIIQAVAILGAILFGWISTQWGNKIALIIMLTIWICICISAYFITSEQQFYCMGALVGLVMGGIQSQARSTWSKLIPVNSSNTASFFSFYDSIEKLAIVCGIFGFAFIEQLTGSMRNSTLLLSLFFAVSLTIIIFTKLKNKEEEVRT